MKTIKDMPEHNNKGNLWNLGSGKPPVPSEGPSMLLFAPTAAESICKSKEQRPL
jgi:hypothetical protein